MKNSKYNMLAQSNNGRKESVMSKNLNTASMLAITLTLMIAGFALVITPSTALAETRAQCIQRCGGTTMAGTNARIQCETGCTNLGSGGSGNSGGPAMKDCLATGERIKKRDWTEDKCVLVDCDATGAQIAKGEYDEDTCVLVDCAAAESGKIAKGKYSDELCAAGGPDCCDEANASVDELRGKHDQEVANLKAEIANLKATIENMGGLPLWLLILIGLIGLATLIALFKALNGNDDGPTDPNDPNYRIKKADLDKADAELKKLIPATPDTSALARAVEDLQNAAPPVVDGAEIERNVFRSVLSALPGQFVSVNEMDERMELDSLHKSIPAMDADLEQTETDLDDANAAVEIANVAVSAVEEEIAGADAKIEELENTLEEADDAVDELPADADAETVTKAKEAKITAKKAVKAAKKAKAELPKKLEAVKAEAVKAVEAVTAAKVKRDAVSTKLEQAHARIVEIEQAMAARKAPAPAK